MGDIISICGGSSRFDNVPVTGHPSGLSVIPATDNRFLRSEPTILKLREKILSWSGDDCSIKVLIFIFLDCIQMSFIEQPMAEKALSVLFPIKLVSVCRVYIVDTLSRNSFSLAISIERIMISF